MLGFATIGAAGLDQAAEFYDCLLDLVGAIEIHRTSRNKVYGTSQAGGMLSVGIPHILCSLGLIFRSHFMNICS